MGSQQFTFEFKALLPSTVLNMKTIVCLAAFIAVSAAFLPAPPPPPHYRPHGYPRPSPLGGAMDPTTLLLLNKNGGFGGAHGKGFNPLLFSLLGGCKEEHSPCTKIADANADATKKCGLDTGTSCNGNKCNMCCTCN